MPVFMFVENEREGVRRKVSEGCSEGFGEIKVRL